MRIPDPKANTTTEAYLAYKAGYLEESELKPVLYEPYLHFDAWLAYWAGLTDTYPNKGPEGKNLIGLTPRYTGPGIYNVDAGHIYPHTKSTEVTIDSQDENSIVFTSTSSYSGVMIASSPVDAGKAYIMTGNIQTTDDSIRYTIYTLDASYTVVRKVSNASSGDISRVIQVYAGEKFIAFAGRGNSSNYTATISNLQLEEGDTATEYEPYYATPEMLTDEEALVAYLSGVTDTYPEEIKDPYDVRIVGYLKYLVSARWGRPEYPVNNEEFYLSTMKPPVVPSGDTPSSDIEMDDTAEAPFIDLKMYGDTSQQTYSGKNKVFFAPITITASDIDWVVTKDTITASGTASSNWSIPRGFVAFATPLPAGSYVFSIPSAIDKALQFNMRDSNDTTYDYTIQAGSTYVSFTTSYEAKSFRFALKAEQGVETNITMENKLQLEAGSTPTAFEPYVGGVPAPSPDYPQDVNVVTGRQVVGVRSNNLFDRKNAIENTILVWSSGVDYAETGSLVGGYIDVNEGDKFVSNYTMAIFFYDSSSNYLGVLQDDEGTVAKKSPLNTFNPKSFTIPNGLSIAKMRIEYRKNKGDNPEDTVALNDIMLNAGTTLLPYIPSGADYEINLGKNIVRFTSDNLIQNNGSMETATMTFGDNYIDFVSVVDVQAVQYAYYYTPELKPENAYTISFDIEKIYGLSNNRFTYSYSDDGSSWSANANVDVALDTGESDSVVRTFTGHKYYRFGFYNCTNSGAEKGTHSIFKNIQFELGDTATPYAPYFEPIELCKIGDYQDYIYQDADGDWYVHKEIKKIVLDGSETWYEFASSLSSAFITEVDAINPSSRTTGIVISDRFIEGASTTSASQWNNFPDGTVAIRQYGTEPKIGFKNSVANNLSSWKTWLSTHNTTVYYALATATDTKITNSELISQLDALMEGGSYEGKTYIKVTATDPNLPGLLYVEAGKYD